MPLIKPFAGLRPAPGRAAEVAAPPYDVMNAAEARAMVQGCPWSFLHISRPEVDLPEGTDPYAPEVYAKARENLDRMLTQGVLVRDPEPRYYVYRLTMGDHSQTGLVAAASVAAYDAERIKRHELTRPVKEDDRVRQIDALNAQTGPAFLVYRANTGIDQVLERASRCAISSGPSRRRRPSRGLPPPSRPWTPSTWPTVTIAPPPPPGWPPRAGPRTRGIPAKRPTSTSSR
jgi:uncharacterized protein (DUF1015 family)